MRRSLRYDAVNGPNDKHGSEFVTLRSVERTHAHGIFVRRHLASGVAPELVNRYMRLAQCRHGEFAEVPISRDNANVSWNVVTVRKESSDLGAKKARFGRFVFTTDDDRLYAFSDAELWAGLDN